MSWDLIEVSREEFDRRREKEYNVIAQMGEIVDDDSICITHYSSDHVYIGSIKVTEDGVLYLVPEECGTPLDERELSDILQREMKFD